ncbi:unnamed protein product, partial [Candidula unifasciata]
MTSAWILLLVLLTIGSTESLPLMRNRQPPKESPYAERNISITITVYNNTDRYNMTMSLPHNAILSIKSLKFVTTADKTETFWNQRRSQENKISLPSLESFDSGDVLRTTEDRELPRRIH